MIPGWHLKELELGLREIVQTVLHEINPLVVQL